jgi:hypothetical protein
MSSLNSLCALPGGGLSDLQVFGYDEARMAPEDRARSRRDNERICRQFRQELYLNFDPLPIAVIEWRHSLGRIEVVSVSQARAH